MINLNRNYGMQKSRGDAVYYGILFVLAAAMLLFCSMASPLFPIHNRVDQNIFMTVGREIARGKVLYRDLFEQKGPVVYFLHAAAYRLTGNNFYGIYIFEIPALFILLVYIDKIAGLYTERRAARFITVTAGIVIVTAGCFLRGDNVEEFCLPLWAICMYHLLVQIRRPAGHPVPMPLFFFGGVCAGLVLWTKFTMLGFWAAWGLILAVRLIRAGKTGRAVAGGVVFAAGLAAATLPWVIYFTAHNALYDWLYVSIYVNIAFYPSTIPLIVRPFFPIAVAFVNAFISPPLCALIFVGVRDMIRKKRPCICGLPVRERRAVWITFTAAYYGMYIGGVFYDYYMLFAAGYCVFGLIYVSGKWGRQLGTFCRRMGKWRIPAVVMTACAAVLLGGNCLFFYGVGRDGYVQFSFADIMKQTPGATLLNYGFIDGGLYMASDTRPLTKYIGSINIDYDRYPDMEDTMRGLMRDGVPDYVMIRMRKKKSYEDYDCAELKDNYHVVGEGFNHPDNYRFYLLKRNDRHMLYPVITADPADGAVSTRLVNEKWETAAQLGNGDFRYIKDYSYNYTAADKVYGVFIRDKYNAPYSLNLTGERISALDGMTVDFSAVGPVKIVEDENGQSPRFGLFDFERMEMIAAPCYDSIIPAEGGAFFARDGANAHLLDAGGALLQVVPPAQWDDYTESIPLPDYEYTVSEDKLSVVNKDGNSCFTPGDGLYVHTVTGGNLPVVSDSENRLGLYDMSGRELLPREYGVIYSAGPLIFTEQYVTGNAAVFTADGQRILTADAAFPTADSKYIGVTMDGYTGFTDLSGTWVYKEQASSYQRTAAVTDMLLPDEYSGTRTHPVTHIMVHFMSAVVSKPSDPFSVEENRKILMDADVSTHYVITREGEILCFVPESRIAWHAGKGTWGGDERYTDKMNRYAIGIELMGIGTREEMSRYITEQQYDRLNPSWKGFTDAQYASFKPTRAIRTRF